MKKENAFFRVCCSHYYNLIRVAVMTQQVIPVMQKIYKSNANCCLSFQMDTFENAELVSSGVLYNLLCAKHVRPRTPLVLSEYNLNYRRCGVFLTFNRKRFHECTGRHELESTDMDAEQYKRKKIKTQISGQVLGIRDLCTNDKIL